VESKKEFRFLVLLLVAMVFVRNASAIPGGGTLDANYTGTFAFEYGSAEVDCEVYGYTSGEYVYAYQVSNIDSGIGLSFFSVGIKDGANAFDPDHDSLTGVTPANWDTVGSPVQSVDALFTSPINNGSSSEVLWFVSNYASTLGEGALFGMSSGSPKYAGGGVLTPVPEPATILLLGIGGALITLTRKRRLSDSGDILRESNLHFSKNK
jgi:hypothetical protein